MAYTTLEAVNKILRGLGEPPATSLDTGGTSIEGEAEDMLDEQNTQVQTEGWAVNTEYEVELKFADRKLPLDGTLSGTFVYDETVTETTTGATGKFKYLDTTNDIMYLVIDDGSAAFQTDGTNLTLTGGTSGATHTSTGLAVTQTEGKVYIDTTWLRINPDDDKEYVAFVPRGENLYDTDDNTENFDDKVTVDIIKQQTFTELPHTLQEYIIAMSALELADYKKRGAMTKDVLERKAALARVAATQEDSRLRNVNVFATKRAKSLLGNRYRYYR